MSYRSTAATNRENEPITILRIKRKRTDEPLDALVVETPDTKKKKGATSAGVFTFAETIEEDDFFQSTEALHKRIADLSRQAEAERSPARSPSTKGSTSISRTIAALPRSSRSYSIVEPKSPTTATSPRALVTPQTQPGAPPVIASTAGAALTPAPPEPSFRVFDAIPSEKQHSPKKGQAESAPEPDPMDAFTSMVNDYLQLNDIKLDPQPGPTNPSGRPSDLWVPANDEGEDGEDYVYDVFYFRRQQVDDLERLIAREAAVGMISGLPPFEDWDDEDGESDSGPDEVDEDSNEETFYRNDYPDEVSDSDDGDLFDDY